MEQRKSLGYIYALLAVIIWSGNFVIASGLANALPPISLATLRWSTATIVLLPFAAKHMWKERHTLRDYMWPLIASALIGVTCFNTIIYYSARTTTTLNMALLATTTPIFVVFLARIFLGEAISYLRALGLIVAIGGMLTVTTGGDLDVLLHLTFRLGDLWMLLAGLLWAIYSILVKRKPQGISQLSYLGVIFLIGTLPLIPGAIFEQQFHPEWNMTPAIIGATLYIGLGASLAAFFLWNMAVTIIGPGTSSLFQYFIPVFSGIGSFFLLGQPITLSHAIGFVLIFTGVLLATRPR